MANFDIQGRPASGRTRAGLALAFDPGGRVWESGRPAWVADMLEECDLRRRDVAGRAGLHGAFAFPILLGNEVLGVIECFSRAIRKTDEDLLTMVSALGTQMGQFVERKRMEEELARSEKELREKNALMEADLIMARDIQQVFLTPQCPCFPPASPPESNSLRFHHRYRPATAVGGDFFNILPISETQAGVFICDVMGHGLRAALVTAIVRGLVEELMPIAGDPGRFLTQINRGLLAVFRQMETPVLVTAFYMVADLAEGRVRYVNAGHPSPLPIRRSEGSVRPLQSHGRQGPVMGLFQGAAYPVTHSELSPRDIILLFTDGLYEVEGRLNEFYDRKRLLDAVRERIDLPVDALLDEIVREIPSFSECREFNDDVCLVGVEVARGMKQLNLEAAWALAQQGGLRGSRTGGAHSDFWRETVRGRHCLDSAGERDREVSFPRGEGTGVVSFPLCARAPPAKPSV